MYSDYQKITMQETPGTIPAGRLPRHREVILLCDLIDSVKPGDEVVRTNRYFNEQAKKKNFNSFHLLLY
jgi:DNA replication licensing factor MCM2